MCLRIDEQTLLSENCLHEKLFFGKSDRKVEFDEVASYRPPSQDVSHFSVKCKFSINYNIVVFYDDSSREGDGIANSFHGQNTGDSRSDHSGNRENCCWIRGHVKKIV